MPDHPIYTASLEPAGTRDKGGFLKTGPSGTPLRLIKISGPDGAQAEQWINDDQQAADNTIKRLGYKRTGEWIDDHTEIAKKSFKERNKIGIIVATVALVLVILLSVSSIFQTRNSTSSQPTTTTNTTPANSPDALAEMYKVFIGATSQDQIRAALSEAATATALPQNNETYLTMGKGLAAFRKEYGLAELDVLRCIPRNAQLIPTGSADTSDDGWSRFQLSASACAVDLGAR